MKIIPYNNLLNLTEDNSYFICISKNNSVSMLKLKGRVKKVRGDWDLNNLLFIFFFP